MGIHREYQADAPVPRSRGVGPRSLRVVWWAHCDHTRPLARFAAGDHRFLVLRWHRLALYLMVAPWRDV